MSSWDLRLSGLSRFKGGGHVRKSGYPPYRMDIRAGGGEYRFERVAFDGHHFGQFVGCVGTWAVRLIHQGECEWTWAARDGERELRGDRPLPTPIPCVRELLAMAAGGTLPEWRPKVVTTLVVAVPEPAPKPERKRQISPPLAGRPDLHRCPGCGTRLAQTVERCGKCFRRERAGRRTG